APAVVQAGQRDVESAPLLTQQVELRDFHVVEADAGLPRAADTALAAVLLEDVDAVHVGRADQRRDLLRRLPGFGVLALPARQDGEDAGESAAGGPLLLAVEDVVLAILRDLAAGLLPAGIAADVGLGEAERAEPV